MLKSTFQELKLFHIDSLSLIMSALVCFMAILIASFSFRFLKGDRKFGSFYQNLSTLVVVLVLMVNADHLLLLLALWGTGNYFLTRLIEHKSAWEAARQSSFLAKKNYLLGLIFLSAAFLILYSATSETSIQAILGRKIQGRVALGSGLLIILAALTQSALWPFHRWLISSLNAPTPVSALMHAGLVNGGGFLLVRFAPLFLEQTILLSLIFTIGVISVMLGSFWKLMQADVKRMLACSTVSQMGFMFVQCGLGLFSAAVAHLCFHGLFKAYLFLASSSAVQEKKRDTSSTLSFIDFLTATICGVLGVFVFAWSSGKNIYDANTNVFLMLVAGVSGMQFAFVLLQNTSRLKMILALLATSLAGAFYGFSIHLIEEMLSSLSVSSAQPLNGLYLLGFFIVILPWAVLLFKGKIKRAFYPDWLLKAYVYMLNASRPHPNTITAHRNKYKF
jgi:NAD(P)H-quinone oxidoreductase subunit 5